MTDKEIILLFKRDSGMNEVDWERFCKRYATRDICGVVDSIKALYEHADFRISTSFRSCLKREMQSVCKNHNRKMCHCI